MLDRVFPVRQAAEIIGLSVPTLRRVIAAGNGPPLIQLSPRRQGIRESHLNEWLSGRLRDQDKRRQDHARAVASEPAAP
jgi:predicted DNA-binding transcriptional regulator AlpA